MCNRHAPLDFPGWPERRNLALEITCMRARAAYRAHLSPDPGRNGLGRSVRPPGCDVDAQSEAYMRSDEFTIPLRAGRRAAPARPGARWQPGDSRLRAALAGLTAT